MQFKGVLNVAVSAEKNRAGQHLISIEFVGDSGISLQTMGARLNGNQVLDAVAVVKGTSYKHTAFSPALQVAIINGGVEEVAPKPVNQKYQDETTEKYNKRAKEALGG